jgi:hypothetical protein
MDGLRGVGMPGLLHRQAVPLLSEANQVRDRPGGHRSLPDRHHR